MLNFVKHMENNLWVKKFSGERERKEKVRSIMEGLCVRKLIWLYYQIIILEGAETCFVLELGRHIKLNSLPMRHRDKKENTEDKGSLICGEDIFQLGAG